MSDLVQPNHTGYSPARHGVGEETLRLIQALHRQATSPFTTADAATVLSLDIERTRQLLAYLAQRGWLARVRRGLYASVPIEADDARTWQEDPWAIAARAFAPCYVGGWSACEHWGLTDQVFREIVVVSGRRIRQRHVDMQGVSYRVKVRPIEKLFGTRIVWRGRVRVAVSDPSRTIVDCLDDPVLVGGMRHGAEVVSAYFTEGHRDDARLLEYAERLGNRSVFKRLGYMIEALQLDAAELAETCHRHQSTGLTALDPTSPTRGRILRRWNLRVNVAIP